MNASFFFFISCLPPLFDFAQGCLCDPGWQGYDCSEARCPYGDDPHTPYAWVKWNSKARRNVFKDQVNEVQQVVCTATHGGFFLSFRGAQTVRVPYDVTNDELEAALERLPTVEDVVVKIPENPDGPICGAAGVSFTVEFMVPTADVPLLMYSLDGVEDMVITEVFAGTKEYEECSGRGLCNRESGQCECFDGFGSSDGQGSPGDRADCGYSRSYTGTLHDAVHCAEAGAC